MSEVCLTIIDSEVESLDRGMTLWQCITDSIELFVAQAQFHPEYGFLGFVYNVSWFLKK